MSSRRAGAKALLCVVLLSACSANQPGPTETAAKGIAPLDPSSSSPSDGLSVVVPGGSGLPTDGATDVTPDTVPTFNVSAVLRPGATLATGVRTTVDVTVEVVGVVPLQISTSVLLLDAAGHEYPDTPDGIGPPIDYGTVPIGAKPTRTVTIDLPARVTVTQVQVIGLDDLPIDGPATYAR